MTQVAEPEISPTAAPGRVSHWINGTFVKGASGREGAVYDPATGTFAHRIRASPSPAGSPIRMPASDKVTVTRAP